MAMTERISLHTVSPGLCGATVMSKEFPLPAAGLVTRD
jgi:hypothetical protein